MQEKLGNLVGKKLSARGTFSGERPPAGGAKTNREGMGVETRATSEEKKKMIKKSDTQTIQGRRGEKRRRQGRRKEKGEANAIRLGSSREERERGRRRNESGEVDAKPPRHQKDTLKQAKQESCPEVKEWSNDPHLVGWGGGQRRGREPINPSNFATRRGQVTGSAFCWLNQVREKESSTHEVKGGTSNAQGGKGKGRQEVETVEKWKRLGEPSL